MLPQENYGGYQPTEEEQRELESNFLADLAIATGVGTVGAGAGIGFEVERRKRGGSQTRKQAFNELGTDAKTALEVLTGRTAFDRQSSGKEVKRGQQTGGSGNPDDGYRSIRNYAENSGRDSFFNIEKPTSMSDNSSNKKTGDAELGNYFPKNASANISDATINKKGSANTPPPTSTNSNSVGRFGNYEKNPLVQAAIAARDSFNASSEDFLSTERAFRTTRGMAAEGPRSDTAFSRIPLMDAYRDLLSGKKIPGTNVGFPFTYSDDHYNFRREENMNLLSRNAAQTTGSFLGRAASDFTNNGIRSLWWLLNAPQAVSDVVSEGLTGGANRYGLYGNELASYDEALRQNWIDPEGNPLNPSVGQVSDKTKNPYLQDQIRQVKANVPSPTQGDTSPRRDRVYARRRTGNNYSTLLALPAAIGINAGMGLNNPFGGADGYKAASPSQDDPTKTDNVLAEIGIKYILGRRGDILPWSEFQKVRPDVSKEEYMQYKGYKFDKGFDLNPFDDGDFNLGGILKGTDDSPYGGELMFLGKHLPTDTVLLPTAAAMGAAALGTALGQGGALNLDGLDEERARQNANKNALLINVGLEPDGDFIDSQTKELRSDVQTPGLNKNQRKDLANKLNKIDDRIEGIYNRSDLIEAINARDFTIRGTEVTDKSTGKVSQPDNLELKRQRSDRWRKRNPVALGVGMGLGALGVSSLIGNESERRRREENQRQNAY